MSEQEMTPLRGIRERARQYYRERIDTHGNNPRWALEEIALFVETELHRLQPEGRTTDVQRRLIGNLVTRFEMLPTDLEGIVNEQDRNFYEAMLQLVRAVEEGEFWPEPAVAHSSSAGPEPRCPKCGSSNITLGEQGESGFIYAQCNDCPTRGERKHPQRFYAEHYLLADFAQFFAPAVLIDQLEPSDYWAEYQQVVERCMRAEERVQDLETGDIQRVKDISRLTIERDAARERVQELEDWKESAIKLLPMQEWGQALGLPLGSNIHAHILPALQQLTTLKNKIREFVERGADPK